MAIIGGINTGFCLGTSLLLEDNGEQITATLAGIPDSDHRIEVQEQVTTDTAEVKKRFVLVKPIAQLNYVSMSFVQLQFLILARYNSWL